MSSTVYQKLHDTIPQTRLVELQPSAIRSDPIVCTLSTVSLDDLPFYRALSYVWGGTPGPLSILLNGESFLVTESLHAALSHLRPETARVLFWIDALCIDQNNTNERSQQVLYMRDIYKGAAHVVIWLGEEADNSHLAMQLIFSWAAELNKQLPLNEMRLMDAIPIIISKLVDPFEKDAWEAAEKFFKRPWWKRIWVLQEVTVSTDAVVVCGDDLISWSMLSGAALLWKSLHRKEFSALITHQQRAKIMSCEAIVAEIAAKWQVGLSESTNQRFDMLRLIACTLRHQATDPRDKIYGLLGLDQVRDICVKPDYSESVETVYTKFVRASIRAKRNLAVCSVAGVGVKTQQPFLQLPSWVPDFRSNSPGFGDMSYGGPPPFSASKNTEAIISPSLDSRTLQLTAIICDTVSGVEGAQLTDDRWTRFENLALRGLQDPHPTGITRYQAYFRTLITDSSGFGYGNPGFQDEAKKNEFFDLAFGFFCTMGGETFMRDENLSKIFSGETFCKSLAQKQLGDIASIYFAAWHLYLSGNSEFELPDDLLAEFLGSPGTRCRLEWPTFNNTLETFQTFGFNFMCKPGIGLQDRALFVTPKGYIGTCPSGTQIGDLVCVPHGSYTPWAIRREQDHYLMVGECYVYGMMNGEMIDEVKNGSLVEEQLEFW